MVICTHAHTHVYSLSPKHTHRHMQVQVLLAAPDNPGQSCFLFEELQLEGWTSAMANLKLGLAVTLVHVIR